MKIQRTETEQFERIRTNVFRTSEEAASVVAADIAVLIRERQGSGRNAVLGLATGSTPVRNRRSREG
jgi:glucosamine-6-phosphate deaminase